MCQHSCPTGVSFSAAPNARATTIHQRSGRAQGHRGADARRRGLGALRVIICPHGAASLASVCVGNGLLHFIDGSLLCNRTFTCVIFGCRPIIILPVSLPRFLGTPEHICAHWRWKSSAKLKSLKFLKYVIQSAVNKSQGASLQSGTQW